MMVMAMVVIMVAPRPVHMAGRTVIVVLVIMTMIVAAVWAVHVAGLAVGCAACFLVVHGCRSR